MYDVDLMDAVPRRTEVPGFGGWRAVSPAAGDNAGIVERLHRRGIVATCYLDSGAWESYEPDADLFPRAVIGNSTGWAGERWLDRRRGPEHRFAPIIWARLALARRIGCDGVEPDQNNPIGNRPGFPIGRADERSWYLSVARHAHAAGLSVGMKNGVEVINRRTVAAFDWSLNEECSLRRVPPRAAVRRGRQGRVPGRVHGGLAPPRGQPAPGGRAAGLRALPGPRLLDIDQAARP